jgi:hypothetical protein
MLVIVAEDDPRAAAITSTPTAPSSCWDRTSGAATCRRRGRSALAKLTTIVSDRSKRRPGDAAASLPLDVFTRQPDAAAYDARRVDPRLFDPDAALKPFDRRFNWKGLAASPVMDDPDDMRRQLPGPRRP